MSELKFCGIARTHNQFIFVHQLEEMGEIVYCRPYHAVHFLVPPHGDIHIFHRSMELWTLDERLRSNT